MPNWCENELLVRASTPERQQQVLAEIQSAECDILDFNTVLPYPEKFRRKDEESAAYRKANPKAPWSESPDGYNSGGYEWCCKNWGTKWNACRRQVLDKGDKRGGVWLRFDTAWVPPAPVIRALSAKYPDVLFKLLYWEMGQAFRGLLKVQGGKELLKREYQYHGNRGG